MGLNGLTDYIKTDEGYHLVRYAVVAEVDVHRRDDLRGIWEVDNGTMYPDRQTAFDEAERRLDQMSQEVRWTEHEPYTEPDDPEPEQPTGTMIG